ncbi:MAG TPA: transcription-repair coupling factor [Candidatus Avacidaminococcus intestinavium]|uniref:Transcription-repair-coupling factor n=1 Tax=Candidatus Avacidaminococcus intestinavium TaxID=2840684 RepID=A0A9D1MP23_9FIRM|nr:transcription-repair coupling factor [Candidatus Avacidaminococcus intestinavium]
MNSKDGLIELIKQVNSIKKAFALLKQGQGVNLNGVSDAQKTSVLAALYEATTMTGPIVLLVADREAVRTYRRELNYYYQAISVQEFYPESRMQSSVYAKSQEVSAARVMALRTLYENKFGVVFVTAEAAMQKLPAPQELFQNNLTLNLGDNVTQDVIIRKLVQMGYERVEQVDTLGQFCLRGEILDVYPINENKPVRVEWFDDSIDALRNFDLISQRSIEVRESIEIVRLASVETAYDSSVFAYISQDAMLVLDEPVKFLANIQNVFSENINDVTNLLSADVVEKLCEKHACVTLSGLAHHHFGTNQNIVVPVRRMAPYNKNVEVLLNDLAMWLQEGLKPFIMMSSSDKAKNIVENLRQNGVEALYCESSLAIKAKTVGVFVGELTAGFRFWDEEWLLLTENDIWGVQKRKRLRHKQSGPQIQTFSEINEGDYVVHSVHGIGRYLGVETLQVGDGHRDYLLLKYAGDDKLYVPIEHVGLLHKYIGNEGQAPRLSKMGGNDWKRVTTKAKAAITELAAELLRLYAERKIVQGYAYAPDSNLQKEFEDGFPFEETVDQLRAIVEIKRDMEKPLPMDRLLCGDVGYGKTEVAVRAAFKAVTDGKQVAVLVPTTVLAQQHFMTFSQRMEPFGVTVAMVSRFKTAREQREIFNRLEQGKIDVLIGTHRILQSDVVFADLGLLVIDEEQRFGVAQKEKIKKWTIGVDILTLSATPIPRTLHLALVNGRDMSVIESPPEDRLPVETYVAEYNDSMIKEALEREIKRGGQVYYVYNRVQGLERIADKLRKLVAGIDVRIAHGQMGEELLEDTMISFYEGKFDVLLCTTIIENGLDVPLANTIIIDGAENFGLSQLYQMRGRVGRSSRLAYAYFVYKKDKVLTEIAEKRLQAIKDFTELGAGFRIAMRDLEIRGAGNLLGSQQHGHIAGIGFAAYCDLLEKTIKQMKDGINPAETMPEPVLELDVDAYIPDEYMDSPRYKMEFYRHFAEMAYKDKDDLLDELIDRFGTPPPEVITLWRVAVCRSLCRELKIAGLVVKNKEVRIIFAEQTLVDPEKILSVIKLHGNNAKFKNGKQAQLILKMRDISKNVLEDLEKLLLSLA